MTYIEWVGRVFCTIVEEYEGDKESQYIYGLQLDSLMEIYGFEDQFGKEILAIADAIADLHRMGLLQIGVLAGKRTIYERTTHHKPTSQARQVYRTGGLSALHPEFSGASLDDDEAQLLSAILDRSETEHEDYAELASIDVVEILGSLGKQWAGDKGEARSHRVAGQLEEAGFLKPYGHDLKPTYAAAVWIEQNVSGWHRLWVPVEGAAVAAGGQGKVNKVARRDGTGVGALKELHSELVRDTERRNHMKREFDILQRLQIEGVPKVLDHNMDMAPHAGKPLYIVSEWVEGQTASRYINNRPTFLDDALGITRKAADILRQCHEAGVLHRDVKPDNMMIAGDGGKVYILDFGIAWLAPDAGGSVDFRTENQQDLRNRFFSVPDLAAGRRRDDARTDLTQLLGVLVYMLTGRSPRILTDEQGRAPHRALIDVFPKQTRRDERWETLVGLLDKGFQPNIEERFQTAAELIKELEILLTS